MALAQISRAHTQRFFVAKINAADILIASRLEIPVHGDSTPYTRTRMYDTFIPRVVLKAVIRFAQGSYLSVQFLFFFLTATVAYHRLLHV